MIDDLTVLVAGRAAEDVVFNVKTTGAANDIERASKMARAMVAQYGMSDTFGMTALETTESKYLDGRNVATCSEETLTKLDNEVIDILKAAYDKAKKILTENMDALHEIADYLIEKETITGKEFMSILNKVKNEQKNNEETDKENVIKTEETVLSEDNEATTVIEKKECENGKPQELN